ncbi:MAG: 50S ribosomal protein L21, large subunit ribosomal protein L21 [Candidatus Peregrinibacteria bacterium GW2011_GWF2_43_17]|nr:MAG: 50S ribosomal protein L21, large subunit ribosomal protein L21 [Candidatus Peregrinibacteria bacterium GW2011_GWF2_43_17]KKT20433.1 MAG: Ribosomal protein L21 [Candidatus Peregrinibacteria bacterium GW2011_GWA2_43_8]HAU39669.1 50S ribosomal protein L21 [Candidatus Peregrinibacteria bacterium]
MFAVIELAGRQYLVSEKDEFQIEKIPGEPGKNLTCKTVILLGKSESDVELGMPYISGATVELKILNEVRGDKLRIYKKKAKKRYERTQGHVQKYWLIKVLKITKVNGKVKATEEEKVVVEAKPKRVATKKKKV